MKELSIEEMTSLRGGDDHKKDKNNNVDIDVSQFAKILQDVDLLVFAKKADIDITQTAVISQSVG
jgi:hypothetical protein